MSKQGRRDWILLPLLSLFTVSLILSASELISRRVFSASNAPSLGCMVLNDGTSGPRAIPDCVCSYKIAESDLVEYRFNSCGHRAGMECGPKPRDTYRIVLVGTSMAEGLHVPWTQTFAALLPQQLSRATGRRVQVYNEALEWESPHLIDTRFKEVLSVQPDIILWALTKWDVENASLTTPLPAVREDSRNRTAGAGNLKGMLARNWSRVVEAVGKKTVSNALRDGCKYLIRSVSPGTVFLFEHFLSEDPSEYVKRYLGFRDEAAFLRVAPSATWQSELRDLDRYAADMERQAKAAGVPVVATVLPTHAQAAMISLGEWPADLNPYKFGADVRSIIESHGGTYIDLLQGFRGITDIEQDYYPVDGHPNASGQAVFAHLLARGLIGRAVPLVSAVSNLRTVSHLR